MFWILSPSDSLAIFKLLLAEIPQGHSAVQANHPRGKRKMYHYDSKKSANREEVLQQETEPLFARILAPSAKGPFPLVS